MSHKRRQNYNFCCCFFFSLQPCDHLLGKGWPLGSLVCDRNAFFTSEKTKIYHAWCCQNVCDALTFFVGQHFIRFGTKLYRQVVGISMGTNCAPLVADVFLFCYERDFMMSLSGDKQADSIDAFNTTSRYLDDILNINKKCLFWHYGKSNIPFRAPT